MTAAAIEERRKTTDKIVDDLRDAILERLNERADEIIGDHTTFVLTGSAGRGEMTTGSDIDGFVLRLDADLDREHDARVLCATADALSKLGLPRLDRGGEFLAMKKVESIVECLGSADDDHTNALTTRMLVLLEGRPLLGEAAYATLTTKVQDAYRDALREEFEEFRPYFLVNDIIRYWRTVLLNHEERLRQKKAELEKNNVEDLQDELRAHRRYRSQKLRFPRCVTCFSALAYILSVDKFGVSKEDERQMFALAPLDRLKRIAKLHPQTKPRIDRMLDLYGGYLTRSAGSKQELIEKLRNDPVFVRTVSEGGRKFTEEMFHLLKELGQESRLYRQMLI